MPGTSASGGRNAKGRKAHVLAGTFRDDRHGGHDTPEAPKGRPEPPIELTGLALAEWVGLCADLEAEHRLGKTDARAIYQYCKLFAETEQLVEEKAEAKAAVARLDESFGDVEKADVVAFFIEVGKMRKLAASYDSQIRAGRMGIRQYLIEFGMTPAARSRVKLPVPVSKSAAQSFREAKGA